MRRTTSLIFLASLFITFTSVVNQTRAFTCFETLGPCVNCDQQCLAKYGPSAHPQCGGAGISQCMCFYECPPAPPKTCNGGAGLCSQNCPEKCCDATCGQKYNGGHGYCDSLGTTTLCQCQYPC